MGDNEGALQTTSGTMMKVTPKHVAVVRSTVLPAGTPDEVEIYLHKCASVGVHPLDGLIHPSIFRPNDPDERKLVMQNSIDLLRIKSEETGTYAGMDEPEYGPPTEKGYPEWAKVTVYKFVKDPEGHITRVAFTATARWSEYYPGEKRGFMWRDKPFLMLGKCAEALARRIAWPKPLSKMYATEEMQRAEAIEADGSPEVTNKTETVQPAEPEENVTEAEFSDVPPEDLEPQPEEVKLDVSQSLQKEISIHCGLDGAKMGAMLKEVSAFDGKPKGLVKFTAGSEKWRGSALKKARDIIKKEGSPRAALPDSCTEHPTTCGCPTFHDGKALCSDRGSAECPYGLGRTF
jgi:phage recombination protein Bet